jgi:hypothetical protein
MLPPGIAALHAVRNQDRQVQRGDSTKTALDSLRPNYLCHIPLNNFVRRRQSRAARR